MWTIFKVYIEFVTVLLLFDVLFLWPRGTWDPSSPTRDPARTPALQGEALTTGPRGKSPVHETLNDKNVFTAFDGVIAHLGFCTKETKGGPEGPAQRSGRGEPAAPGATACTARTPAPARPRPSPEP